MVLTEEERQRIREEEWVRLQARQDFRQTNPRMTSLERMIAVSVPLFVVATIIFFTATTR
jgi:hypothetical protein